MKKDQIFWVLWAVAVLAAAAVYLVAVGPKRAANRDILGKKQLLAARFSPVTAESGGETVKVTDDWKSVVTGKRPPDYKKKFKKKDLDKIKKRLVGKGMEEPLTDAEAQMLTPTKEDKGLWRLYPLEKNSRGLPNKKLVDAKRAEDKKLADARKDFVGRHFPAYTFEVKDATDFHKPPPDSFILFRAWVKNEDEAIDKAFKAAAPDMEFATQENSVDVFTPGKALRWLSDGRVTGYVENERDREKVKRRLVLRRQLLMALARARASTAGRRLREDGTEEIINQLRRVEKIIDFKFGERRGGRSGPKIPCVPHQIDLQVSCHPAVVPALLREMEAIGAVKSRDTGRLEQKRPFAFWVEEIHVRRVSGWPGSLRSSGDVNAQLVKAKRYGRSMEWPVVAFVSGVVPEFKPDPKLDPAPR